MKLSIITINYNNAEGLRKTLASVAAQSYAKIQHVIVDGNSSDASKDIIIDYAENTKNPNHEIIWISEPDKGIYNAMNKGIAIALGRRIVNENHTSQPIINSFASIWGAHTADSTQYDILKENANANRKNPTEAEAVMWDILKGNNIGYHFRRQHIILDYIVDFICLEKGLVIELDGGYHNDPEQKEYDERRTAHLQRLGYTELRFKNEELLCNTDDVIQKIKDTLENLPSLRGRAGDRLDSLPFREESEVGLHYIQILNSGDILAAPDVTERMVAALAAQCAEIKGESLKIKDEETSETVTSASRLSPLASSLQNCPPILYGNMIKVNAHGKVVGKSGYTEFSLRQFYSSTLNHDCAYIRTDLFEEYGLYDENLKIVSDWKWYLQAIGLGRVKPEYVDIDVTIFDDGGISETNLALRNEERRKVLEELLPPAVLWDYDTHAFEMEQMNRLRRWKLYPLVYFMERVCFKLEKRFARMRRG